MGTTVLTVSNSGNGEHLVHFLARELDVSRRKAKGLLDQRVVFVNARRVWMARHAVRAGDRVEVHAPAGIAGDTRHSILHIDAACIVIDKPPATLATGPKSLETVLRTDLRDQGIAAVHRLDRDTTGCLLFARSNAAREALIESFRAGRVSKTYHALVQGTMTREAGSIHSPIDGKSAISHIRVLRAAKDASYVQVRIETGRTHQIRKHLASIGHPVIGDRSYATRPVHTGTIRRVQRHMLHASALSFPHPTERQRVHVRSPLPDDFRAAMRSVGLAT